MAREYPRFIYSNPKDSKTPGPFIVHTLFPKAIFRFIPCNSKESISLNLDNYPFNYCSFPGDLIMVDEEKTCDAKTKEDLCAAAWKWLMHHSEFQEFMKERKIPL